MLSYLDSPILGIIRWLPLRSLFSCLRSCSGGAQLWLNPCQVLRQSDQVSVAPC